MSFQLPRARSASPSGCKTPLLYYDLWPKRRLPATPQMQRPDPALACTLRSSSPRIGHNRIEDGSPLGRRMRSDGWAVTRCYPGNLPVTPSSCSGFASGTRSGSVSPTCSRSPFAFSARSERNRPPLQCGCGTPVRPFEAPNRRCLSPVEAASTGRRHIRRSGVSPPLRCYHRSGAASCQMPVQGNRFLNTGSVAGDNLTDTMSSDGIHQVPRRHEGAVAALPTNPARNVESCANGCSSQAGNNESDTAMPESVPKQGGDVFSASRSAPSGVPIYVPSTGGSARSSGGQCAAPSSNSAECPELPPELGAAPPILGLKEVSALSAGGRKVIRIETGEDEARRRAEENARLDVLLNDNSAFSCVVLDEEMRRKANLGREIFRDALAFSIGFSV